MTCKHPFFPQCFQNEENQTYFQFIQSKALLGPKSKFLVTPVEKAKQPKGCQFLSLHLHHVIPNYYFNDNPDDEAFRNCKSNLVFLTLADHIRAHEILYQLYKDPRDKGAIFLLQHQTKHAQTEYRRAGAKAVHQKLKVQKRNFWSSEEQKLNAKKSLSKKDALVTRSQGGLKGGYKRQCNRIIVRTSRLLFYFQKTPFLCVMNCKTGGDVLRVLHAAKATPLQRVTPLLTGQRSSLHGWSCIWL